MDLGLCACCLTPLQSNNIITEYYFFLLSIHPSITSLLADSIFLWRAIKIGQDPPSGRTRLKQEAETQWFHRTVMFLSKWQLESGLVAFNSSDFRMADRLQRLRRVFGSWIATENPPGEKRCNFTIKETGKTFERMKRGLFFSYHLEKCVFNLHVCTPRQGTKTYWKSIN